MNVEISGTIAQVLPMEVDMRGDFVQRLILNNVTTISRVVQVNSRVILLVRTDPMVTIPFQINDPISVRGRYEPALGVTNLPVISFAHAPTGFIRYNGKVYR